MERYRSYGPNDDTPLNDGDSYFLGFWSRFQPTFLKAGQAYYAGNMRMDKGTAKVRKGLKALSTDITLTNPPLIVGTFSLATDVPVASITASGTTATTTTTGAHGYTSTNYVNIRGAAAPDDTVYNGDHTITTTSATIFTYTMSGTATGAATGTIFANKGNRVYNNYSTQAYGSCVYADDDTDVEGIVIASGGSAYLYRYGTATITIAYPANEEVAATDECQMVQFINNVYLFRGYGTTSTTLTAASLTQAGGTASCTATTNHGLVNNDWVLVSGASPNGYNGIVQITKTGNTTFTYAVDSGIAASATGTIIMRPCKPPLVWNMDPTGTPAFTVASSGPNATGAPYIKMPAVDWGMFFTSRMVLPWSRDQLILSDVLDPQTYDPSATQFRILPGTADWIVAAFPYQELKLLVLYRKSVHVLLLDATTLANAVAQEITSNFGCVARGTVANCGPYVVWLSDIGVVKMEVSNELNLKNSSEPLSSPIQDIIDTINWAYADGAVATYWNNRYYLAIPTGTQTSNKTVLVYNFLNQAWESVDTYPDGYDIINFHVMSYGGTKRIHTVSSLGYVYLQEENEIDQWGSPGSEEDFAIPASLKTRNYLANTYDLKKVRRFQLEANVVSGDIFTGTYVLSNPDYSLSALSYTADADTDVSLRSTVNRRGISGRLELASTAGRPEFKTVMMEATVSSRATINYP